MDGENETINSVASHLVRKSGKLGVTLTSSADEAAQNDLSNPEASVDGGSKSLHPIKSRKSRTGSRKSINMSRAHSKTQKSKSKIKIKQEEPEPEVPEEEEEEIRLPPECCEGYNPDEQEKGGYDYMRNQMSVPWFQKILIRPERYKSICFSESLLMVDEIGKIAGKMYTTVSEAKWGDQECFCAHSGSFGTLSDGLECGTTITGFVSPDMKTLQEYVYEWAISGEKVMERKTLIMREEDSIHVRIVLIKDGETIETKVVSLGKLEQQNLVTESTNIVLLRWIMLEKRTSGGMDLKTLTFKGTVVKNKYVELGNGWENVKGEQVRTWSIRRTVEFDFGDRLWDSMFNQHARLVLRCQPENTHALIPLWFEPVKEYKGGKFTGCYPPYVWACDAELHAKYLLKKDQLAAEHRSYLLDHPELRALLSDFLQALVLRKPPNVISFAQQYFESFLKFRPESQQSKPADSSTSSELSSSESIRDVGELGEWSGESNDMDMDYYAMRPTISDDGMEKILPEEELYSSTEQTSPDENVTIGPDGKYAEN